MEFLLHLDNQMSTKFYNFEIPADDDDGAKIDWNDYDFMMHEAARVGPGENGAPVVLTPEELERSLTDRSYGINTVANNKISSNRSLPDVRLEM